jgi:hypothetical protein
MFLLALVIEDSLVHWVIGLLAVGLPTVGTVIVALWRQFIAWISPLIKGFFDSHQRTFDAQRALAEEMQKQVPVVADTLQKLGQTQQQQCETLDQHSETLERHGDAIHEILSNVRRSNEISPV